MAITRSYLMKKYIDKEMAKGGIQLPIGIIERNADEYANAKIQSAMITGNIDILYAMAWEKLAPLMPEHTRIV